MLWKKGHATDSAQGFLPEYAGSIIASGADYSMERPYAKYIVDFECFLPKV